MYPGLPLVGFVYPMSHVGETWWNKSNVKWRLWIIVVSISDLIRRDRGQSYVFLGNSLLENSVGCVLQRPLVGKE